jgi:hypothetical protein
MHEQDTILYISGRESILFAEEKCIDITRQAMNMVFISADISLLTTISQHAYKWHHHYLMLE